jgi:hypothetical protein
MGGLLSTVQDLSRWVAAMMAAWTKGDPVQPVSRWSLREAQELARFAAISEQAAPIAEIVATGYGFGLMVEEHQVLGRVVSHSGGYPGFGSHMRWHPGSGWGVIALGNSSYAAMNIPASTVLARLVMDSGTAHGAKPAIAVPPWPQTVRAMDVAEDLLRGSDGELTDDVWSPNMDLDLPRDERLAALCDIRDAIGRPRRVDGTVEHPTPGRAVWTVAGDAGSARMDVWMTPERVPRIQKLSVSRLPS